MVGRAVLVVFVARSGVWGEQKWTGCSSNNGPSLASGEPSRPVVFNKLDCVPGGDDLGLQDFHHCWIARVTRLPGFPARIQNQPAP